MRHKHLLALALSWMVATVAAQQPRLDFSAEPIAFVGHGAMFDRDGNEINPTPQFIDAAIRYYTGVQYQRAPAAARAAYDRRRGQLFSNDQLRGQDATVADAALLSALVRESGAARSGSVANKVSFLRGLLTRRLSPLNQPLGSRAEFFQQSAATLKALQDAGLSAEPGARVDSTAYIKECNAAGVPIPPDWGDATWVSTGILEKEFISADKVAEVFIYRSAAPEGACIALPRSVNDRIDLLGVICVGKATSNACFWDNQKEKQNVPITKGSALALTEFAGGPDLEDGSGGVCTECHRGENPFILHPKTPLGSPALAKLVTRPDAWYKPRVAGSWPQNPGPMPPIEVEGVGSCNECHTQRSAGRFPTITKEDTSLAYCRAVLDQAIARTMPPANPGDPDYAAHAKALQALCPPASPTPVR